MELLVEIKSLLSIRRFKRLQQSLTYLALKLVTGVSWQPVTSQLDLEPLIDGIRA